MKKLMTILISALLVLVSGLHAQSLQSYIQPAIWHHSDSLLRYPFENNQIVASVPIIVH